MQRKAELKDQYERWQTELGYRFFHLYNNPSAFRHIDVAEMRKCLKFSPVLRNCIRVAHGDLDLAAEVWGRPRDINGHLPFDLGVGLFSHVPGTVDEGFAARTLECVGT